MSAAADGDLHEPRAVEGEPPGDTTGIAAGVYGLIIVTSVLAAAQLQTLRAIIGLVVVTLLVYWLSEQYAENLAHSLAGRRPERGQFRSGLRRRWPMVRASYLPVVILVGCYLVGISTSTAVWITVLVCVTLLFVLGWRGGRRRGLHLRGRLLSSAAAGSLGLALVVLKLLVK